MLNRYGIKVLVGLLFITAVTPAQALEVDAEKSIVLVKAFNTNEKSGIKDLVFRSMGSNKKFVVKTYGRHAFEVAAGEYYLSRINYINTSPPVKPLRISRPKDNVGTIVVAKGSITYIGDWGVSIDLSVKPRIYDWKVNYDLESLKKFSNKYPEIMEHKLNISNDMGAVYQVGWESIVK